MIQELPFVEGPLPEWRPSVTASLFGPTDGLYHTGFYLTDEEVSELKALLHDAEAANTKLDELLATRFHCRRHTGFVSAVTMENEIVFIGVPLNEDHTRVGAA